VILDDNQRVNTPFARIADLSQQLEETSKRLDMTALLADFLRGLSAEEVPPSVHLTIGQVFPEWDERVLSISGQAVSRVVDGLTDASPVVQEEIAAQALDGGERVRMLLERARRQPPQPPPLTILDVFRTLEDIATATGKGSRGRKETLLRGLLSRATPIEAKFLVKVIYQDMRHGVLLSIARGVVNGPHEFQIEERSAR
jgi:DNA ligase-1